MKNGRRGDDHQDEQRGDAQPQVLLAEHVERDDRAHDQHRRRSASLALSAPVETVSTGGEVGFAMCDRYRAAPSKPLLESCPAVAGAEGIEPPTSGFGDQRSAN